MLGGGRALAIHVSDEWFAMNNEWFVSLAWRPEPPEDITAPLHW
jgi:hypothetical protein